MEILWSGLFWFSLLPASLHPIRSQVIDLVRFVVINFEVVLLYSVLLPVQAKLPKLLHICLKEHYKKIFKFLRSSEATQPVLSAVLGYLCCSAGAVAALGAVMEQWVQVTPWQVSDWAGLARLRDSLSTALLWGSWQSSAGQQELPCISWQSSLSAT